MGWLLNICYLIGILLAVPWLLWRRVFRRKRLGGLWAKLTGGTPHCELAPRIWLHAVSVGEVLLLKPILDALATRYPRWECVLSVTTATGREVAERTYPNLTVFWFPLDLTWAVRRALRRVQPRLIVLAELELWPNFIRTAEDASIPVVVVNGRVSERSFRGYHRLRPVVQPMLRRVSVFAVQQDDYAERLRGLGVSQERLRVTGSVKFDGVQMDRCHPRVNLLRAQLGLEGTGLTRPMIWVVGSTQAPEEAWALEIYRDLKEFFPKLRLVLVPRHQERFEQVAEFLADSGAPFVRKSRFPVVPAGDATMADPVILIDTLGELRYVWGLAHVAFVGGSFNNRGGQNMIEPAAYGAAVTFGPNTWNFQHTVEMLVQHDAAVQVRTKEEWARVTWQLLSDRELRTALGERACALVRSQQGATERTLEVLGEYLDEPVELRRAG